MANTLDAETIARRIKRLPEWEQVENRIERVFEFDEFMGAIDFVNAVAEVAEDAWHHPDITVNYTLVTVSLTSHDLGCLTDSDFEVAGRVDSLVD